MPFAYTVAEEEIRTGQAANRVRSGSSEAFDLFAVREYQTTAVSCLKGDTARQTGPGTYTVGGDVLTVRLDRDRDHATLGAASAVGHRKLVRVSALPAACTRPTPKGPPASFDVFWQS